MGMSIRRSELLAAIEDAKSTLRRLEGMLEMFDRGDTYGGGSIYKTETNRLSETGRDEVMRLIKIGKTDSEISRIVGVTPAAVARYR